MNTKCSYQPQFTFEAYISFHFILCVYVVRIVLLCYSHELYLYLCFILVVYYIVFVYSVTL